MLNKILIPFMILILSGIVPIRAQIPDNNSLRLEMLKENIRWVNINAIKAYLVDTKNELKDKYPLLVQKTDELEKELAIAKKNLLKTDLTTNDLLQLEKVIALKREIILENPILDMDRIIVAKFKVGNRDRKIMAPSLCRPPGNYMGLMDTPHTGYDGEICELSDLRNKNVKHKTIFKPENGGGISDLQLHWNAERLMFVTPKQVKIPNSKKVFAWHIYEKGLNNNSPVKWVTNIPESDLEYADPCYLPDGRILFTTNIGYNGIPCENGDRTIHNLAVFNPKNGAMRKTSFDQDGNWSPTVLNNGRIMYTRWEYTDLTHYFSRIVMHANPDGTNTKALYGSGSFWPNSIYDMQQLPNNSSQFIGIATGHHGVAHSGRLFIFDPAKGRKEEKGVVQEIPFRDRITVPEIKDYLVDGVWPQFSKPFPLNDKYFVVACKPHERALWGVYLVDVFDNMTLIVESEGEGYMQPIPVIKRPVPPVITDVVIPESKDATVFIQDLYEGEGLRGVPRGTIKQLRVFAYEFCYLKSPSDHDAMGFQSGWDIKRELGTVKVEEDGSVIFKVPANTPISLQPLDDKGRAVQLMRSWFTAMPGEVLSCVGCHEDQNSIALPKRVLASKKKPDVLIAPEGGVRPFTFENEVQPILDRYCISCHDGISDDMFTLRGDEKKTYKRGIASPRTWEFSKSYLNLHPYVYRQGPEADMYVLQPYEYHASNSELIQKLEKGHYGVKIDEKDMQTLTKWIDLNTPYRGSFDIVCDYKGYNQYERRKELMKKYGNVDVDWKKEITDYAQVLKNRGETKPVKPQKVSRPAIDFAKLNKWAFDRNEARKMQSKDLVSTEKKIEIAPGVSIQMVWIPQGNYIKLEYDKTDANPIYRDIKIDKGFWMGAMEISNEQYRALFPDHDSRYVGQQWKDHTTPGYPVNKPEQPVVRVSWLKANEFCKKVSEKTGMSVTLPSAEQWEWACRAGSASDMWFGDADTDYSRYENLADSQIGNLAVIGVDPKPMSKNDPLREFWDFVPRDTASDDGCLITSKVGQYRPNPWGLYDIHGNVAEWTLSDSEGNNKVVCGGSWRDRAKLATANSRRYYKPWQAPFNVGFRIIIN